MKNYDAIDLVGYAVADIRRYHAGECSAEFTEDDVLNTIRSLLMKLIGDEPTDDDCRAVLNF